MNRINFTALYVLLISAISIAQISEFKILPSDGSSGDWFGKSVSISGDYVIVGAEHDGNFFDVGSAYIFKRDSTIWIEQQKLTGFSSAEDACFGKSVSISGEYAIVGSNENMWYKGAAYTFNRNGSNWWVERKLEASDGATNDYFGCSVSISGDYVIVGSMGDDDNGDVSGSAYIFKKGSGAAWIEEQKLLASDGNQGDLFGTSVSISGDYIIVGAWANDDNGDASGSAYIFKRIDSTWTEEQKLLASDGAAGDHFGCSVSISGDYAVIGAIGDDDNGNTSGSVYIFKREVATWIQEQKLLASDGAPNDQFGGSVSISGDYAIGGAKYDNYNGYLAGSAYIFHRDSSTWTEIQKLLASDGAPEDFFSHSVSISEDYAIVGAYGNDDNGSLSGSAYIYSDYIVGVEGNLGEIPKSFILIQNYPNPFNPKTTISFAIPESEVVELKVFDLLGNEVATLLNEYKEAGKHNVEFNGSLLTSGIYFYRIKAGKLIQAKKMVLMK